MLYIDDEMREMREDTPDKIGESDTKGGKSTQPTNNPAKRVPSSRRGSQGKIDDKNGPGAFKKNG